MKKRTSPFLCGMLLSSLLGCAASTPQNVLEKYTHACAKGDVETAKKFRQQGASSESICPDQIPHPTPTRLEIVAKRADSTFVKQENTWQLIPPDALKPNTLAMRLRALEAALAERNVNALKNIIVPEKQPKNDRLEAWIDSNQANDLYAALRIHSKPWFLIQKNSALCAFGGVELRFLYKNGWFWDFQETSQKDAPKF